jgi:hypothetical protein
MKNNNENSRLLGDETTFFEDINSRILDREKVKLKEYLCQQHFGSNYLTAELIKSRSKASQDKDTVVITQTEQANDNHCMVNVNITFANAYAEQNQNICIVKQIAYPDFIELMNKIKKSSDSCCCCCSIQ